MSKRLAIIGTHPIQYYAPIFKLLAKKIELKVFYTMGNEDEENFDRGFGKKIVWDIPLLEDYNHEFLQNIAIDKGSHHFLGINNPDAIKRIEQFKPEAILVYGWAYRSHLKIIRHFSGNIPIYFRGDSTLLDAQNGLKSIFKQIFLKWVYKHIDFAFYVGEANKDYFKNYGLKEGQLIFAPHAIDNERFSADRGLEAIALRNNFGVEENDILILFAGKLEVKKNPELLLNAFIEIVNESEVLKESEVRSQKTEVTSIKFKVQSPESEVMKKNALNDQTISPLGDVRRTGVHLLFVGNGELEERLKKKVGLGLRVEGLAQKLKLQLDTFGKEVEKLRKDEIAGDRSFDPSFDSSFDPSFDSAQDDISQDDISQDDNEKDDISQDDNAKDDNAKDDIAKGDISQDDISQDDISQDDISQDDIAKDDNAKDDIAKGNRIAGNRSFDSPFDSAQDDISQDDISQDDNAKGEILTKQKIEPTPPPTPSRGGQASATQIHFLDFQNQTQMPVVYQACDLFCLPSQSESWGLAVNEAMACGKAVLVSDQVGSHPDLVSAVNGAIFKSGNLADLKSNLIALCQFKEQLTKMGEQSKETIQDWSFESQANIIYETING